MVAIYNFYFIPTSLLSLAQVICTELYTKYTLTVDKNGAASHI